MKQRYREHREKRRNDGCASYCVYCDGYVVNRHLLSAEEELIEFNYIDYDEDDAR